VQAVGVAWGYHAPDELTASGAATVANDYPQLGRYLLGA
jgi:phosphoglycolate phosphatase-like HAD superfamily hydrolase